MRISETNIPFLTRESKVIYCQTDKTGGELTLSADDQ